MKLAKYTVTNFRSVRDSGWIETDQVTALIGENESGKSNLLLPLWKLNPAREGGLQATSDYPKAQFNEIRAAPGNYPFITAIFETGEDQARIAAAAGITAPAAAHVEISRYYDGCFKVEFPDCDLANYRFRLAADGEHFRIWVSDDRRPEEIELEARSTGLQWFLSFFLVFLVESEESHRRAILLLDEPGMSLHPLAQRDLSDFFEGLSETNPLLYTSHSPFLVQADRLDRARKVYVDKDGSTKVSSDLRKTAGDPQPGAAYAVHSAVNLGIAESLLVGCNPIIVDGPSDQHYLTTIKTLLVAAGHITPQAELVFPPAGGAKTARIIASILTGRDEQLPFILSDDDVVGRSAARELREGLYANAPDRVLSLKDFVFEGAEVEDLFPANFLADILDRNLPRGEQDIRDVIEIGKPFVQQVEAWAKINKVDLPKHWKVDLSLAAKKRALQDGITKFDNDTIERWRSLFQAFVQPNAASKTQKKRPKEAATSNGGLSPKNRHIGTGA